MKLSKSRTASRAEGRSVIKGIYPEIKAKGKEFWRRHVIHHLDGNPYNNDPNNLIVLTNKDHGRYHKKLREFGITSKKYKKVKPKRELTPAERNILVTFLYNKGLTSEIPQSIRA